MNDNTILRIKVPAHLYESVKEQLTITEAKKSGKAFGDWTVVKEKKLPKDGMKKVEETIEETNENMEKKTRTLDELKSAKSKLEKKIEEMENGDGKIDEIDPKFQGAMDVLGSIPGIDKIAQIDPFTAGVALVGMVVGGLVAAPKIEKGIKALMAKIKDPKKKAQLAAAAEKGGVSVGGGVM
jgi:phage terminase large subunit-like protein